MPRRPQSWTLVEHEDGSWSLEHGNRALPSTTQMTRQQAMKLMVRRRQPGERVYVAEPDGYRTEITRRIDRERILRH